MNNDLIPRQAFDSSILNHKLLICIAVQTKNSRMGSVHHTIIPQPVVPLQLFYVTRREGLGIIESKRWISMLNFDV